MSQLSSTSLLNYQSIAIEAAKAGGLILKRFWNEKFNIHEKAHPGDLVTDVDKCSEEAIRSILYKQTPECGILAEEGGKSGKVDSDLIWIVDPLDGTVNFAHHYPFFCVSIALTYKEESILGVVYDPIHEELFTAIKGQGAFLHATRLHISTTQDLSKSLLVTGFAYDRTVNSDTNYPEFAHFTHITQGVRRSGSAALDLAYVAAGRCDGYWERGIKPWDIAAGILLVLEAGGECSLYDGATLHLHSGEILATNGAIHPPCIEHLQKIRMGRVIL